MLDSIFFDRDGVINVDFGYVHQTKDLVLVDGALDFLEKLPSGIKKFIVTNQAGIARGYYNTVQFEKFMAHLYNILSLHNITFTDTRYCPHHPEFDASCSCRKPKPGMILDLVQTYDVDVSNSMMVGDRLTDCAAGYAAGIKYCVLIGADTPETVHPYIYHCFDYAALENLMESIKAYG